MEKNGMHRTEKNAVPNPDQNIVKYSCCTIYTIFTNMCKASLTRLTAGFPGAFRPATLYLAFFQEN